MLATGLGWAVVGAAAAGGEDCLRAEHSVATVCLSLPVYTELMCRVPLFTESGEKTAGYFRCSELSHGEC